MKPPEQTGPAYGWLGPLRGPLRASLFRVLRLALQTEDGRRILADALHGLLPLDPRLHPDVRDLDVPVYPELGTRTHAQATAPIFITGRFRSGSTLLWQIFRHMPGCRSYYEPFNERRWFDARIRGTRIDPSHVGVSNYWLEYEGLERLHSLYDERWIDRRLFMDADSWDPRMHAYIQALIDAAAPRRAVLQFNRVDFRLPLLRRTFPDARIVHIYRHPRDQWCSALGDLSAFPKEAPMRDFEPHDHFYLLSWTRDLRYRFPFLNESDVTHPYELFYFIWKLSYLFGRRYAHHSVAFERLVTDPDTELPRILDAAAVARGDIGALKPLIASQRFGKWTAYAGDEWFKRHEMACETTLAAFLRQVGELPPGAL